MRKLFFFTVLVSILLSTSCNTKKTLDNEFYAFNTSMFMPNAPESFGEKIDIVQRLGYHGLGSGPKYYFEQQKAIDSLNFRIPEIYTSFNVDKPKNESTEAHVAPNLKAIIQDLKGSKTIISLSLRSESSAVTPSKEADKYLVQQLQLLADYAAEYEVQLSIYPHAFFYCQKIEHALKLVKMVDRPNLGMTINLCHMLKVEGIEGYQDKIKKALPYLRMVSISGADSGDTQMMNWEQLIQTLGKGSFDTYDFVKNLKDLGYDGMIGLQCYGIKEDFEKSLINSMNTWKKYQVQYNAPPESDY